MNNVFWSGSYRTRALWRANVIKGTRLTVEYVLNLLGHDATVDEILDEYEGLSREDIQGCLLFAAQSMGNTAFLPLAETA